MRREWSGLSGPPKLGLATYVAGVGERSVCREAGVETTGGAYRSEDAGLSTRKGG
jgi:hypothetical protein